MHSKRPKPLHLLFALACTLGALARPAAVPAAETTPPRESFDDYVDRAFSTVQREQVPTGILLESGAIFGSEVIRVQDGGEEAAPLSARHFDRGYHDLRRADLDDALPSRSELKLRADAWQRAGVTPIGLAVIEYDTLSETVEEIPFVDGVLALPEGRLGETRRFVATRVFAAEVDSRSPDFVVPAELLIRRGSELSVSELAVQIGDDPAQAVELDQVFRPRQWPAASGDLAFTVSALVDGSPVVARGTVPFLAPERDPNDPVPPIFRNDDPVREAVPCTTNTVEITDATGTHELRHYDLVDDVVGDVFAAPWEDVEGPADQRGRLEVRVIPSGGSVQMTLGGECTIALENPVVLVDGFDALNNRRLRHIVRDYGPTIKQLVSLGFDAIVVDYWNGRDWLERNGAVLRELLVNELHSLVAPGVLDDDRVAVVAGSMGTQVARWALVEAESMGLDHNTGLFVAIDGPFDGANIPIGFQAATVDLAFLAPELADFRDALESPAASQMLLRTFPRGANDSNAPGWYTPRPEQAAYYNAAAALGGLPGFGVRSVTAANGAGGAPETLQTDLGEDVVQFSAFADTDPLNIPFGRATADLTVRGDGANTEAFSLDICFQVLFLPTFCLGPPDLVVNGVGLDVAAGGYRNTTLQFLAPIEDRLDQTIDIGGIVFNLQDVVELSYEIDRHSFIPTASAFGIWNWDNQVHEKCNTEHATPTPTVASLLFSELLAFQAGGPPPAVAPVYQNSCDQPEPTDYCFPGVLWYEDADQPVYLEATFDPPTQNCRVADSPTPNGLIIDNSYAVATCPAGGPPTATGCPITAAVPPVRAMTLEPGGVLEVEVLEHHYSPGLDPCPPDTTLNPNGIRFENGSVFVSCLLPAIPGVSPSDLFVEGLSLMAPLAAECSQFGIPFPDGQPACYLGSAPDGTTAIFDNGTFYYDGAD